MPDWLVTIIAVLITAAATIGAQRIQSRRQERTDQETARAKVKETVLAFIQSAEGPVRLPCSDTRLPFGLYTRTEP